MNFNEKLKSTRSTQNVLPDGQRPAGLTRADRDIATQQAINEQYGGYELPSIPYMRQPIGSFSQRLSQLDYQSQVYNESLENFQRQFHAGKRVNGDATQEIQKIAEAVSPYYRKFKGSDYITIDTPEWNSLASQYAALYNSYGEDRANEFLANAIKDNIASNQSVLEKGWYAIRGMGADAAGSAISTAGLFYGLGTSITGLYDKNPNLNGWQNFWNNVIDNEVTRYGNDVIQYGTIRNLDEARKLGLSDTEIMATTDQANAFLSWNTPFEVLQQGGFTVASILSGMAYAKAANLAFKGLKKTALATARDLEHAKNALTSIQRAQNINNRFIIPGVVGTTEGVVEGLQTKINAQQYGYQLAAEAQRRSVEEEVQRRLEGYTQILDKNDEVPTIKYYDKDGHQVDVGELYNQVWDEMSPKFQESLEQVDYDASRAGIGNFFVNSAINGMLNMTLKAGLQAESVQKSLQNWKLTGWAMPKSNFKITGNAGNVRVTPNVGKAATVFQIAKEPIGEFTEEYLQSLSDSFFSGFADANIHSFIDNKYNGDAQAAIGDVFAGDWGAAWTELGNSLTSKESLKAGVYGALSSIIGTAKLQGYKSNDGKVFKRGTNAKGETESTWEMIQRLTPWRSGLVANIRQTNRDKDATTIQAQALQDWLNDPNNRGKFDGLTGSLSWMKEIGESGIIGDEYNYRNSTLGKAINDIFMLQKAEGSELYNSIMEQLTNIAYMEPNSEQAQSYIKAIRDNVNTNDSQQTDEDIFKSLKDNAKKILNLMSQVQSESDKIEKLVGEIDEDSKQSLIFSQLSLDDWQERSNKLKEEIAKIKIENSTDHSTELTDKQKRIIAEYGNLNEATKAAEKLKERKAGLEGDIKDLEKRKDTLTKQEQHKLKELRATVKSIDGLLNSLKELSTVPENANITLNEEEIMALDPIKRAQMILRGKRAMYAKLYQGKEQSSEEKTTFSEEQQRVINNLVNAGMAQDKDFLGKIVDLGRIESARQRFLRQYNQVLTDQSGLRAYALEAKAQAADAVARQRADEIANISNYQEFASALDNALNTMSERSKRVLIKKLRGTDNFETWNEQRKVLESLFTTISENDKFQELDGNSADLFATAVAYLYENSIDLNDENAVFDALTATDEEGYNKFVSYVNRQNEGVPTDEQVVFTNIEEVFQTYKDVLQQVKYDKEAQRKAAEPIPVDSNVEQGNPTPAPTPTPEPQPATDAQEKPKSPLPGVFGGAYTSPEGGRTKEEVNGEQLEVEGTTPLEQAKAAEKGENANQDDNQNQDPIIDSFKTNNNQSVVDMVKQMLGIIRNDAAGSTTKEAKNVAENALKSIGENDTYNTIEELQSAVNTQATHLESSDADTDILAASLLRRAANFTQTATKQKELTAVYPTANTNAVQISLADIAYAKREFPNSPTTKFYEIHEIERFLSDNDIMDKYPDIFFITDASLTEQVKQDMGDRYSDKNAPIIAAVKHPNGKYIINGEHYQPIGLLPSTGVKWSQGSNRVAKIRNLAKNEEGVHLIEFEGKPLTTKPYGKGGGVRATPRDHNNRTNTSIHTIFNNDYTADERTQLEGQDKATRRNNPIYQAAKRRFIKNLQLGIRNNDKALAYMQPNMKDGGNNSIFVYVTPIESTVGRNSDLTLIQTLESGNVDDAINFNSRTKGVLRAVDNFLKNMPSTENADSDVITSIQNSASSLQQGINRYIYLSPRSGFKYSITPVSGTEGILNGERIFNLELVNEDTGERITLSSFTKNVDAKNLAHDIIQNLLMDGGSLRTLNGTPIVKWQVDFTEVEKAKNGNKEAANNVSDWVDDNILELPATSLQYDIKYVEIETPFKNDGNLRFPPTQANSTNATSPTPMNVQTLGVDQVQSGERVVDGETGATLQGKPTSPVNQALVTAKQKVDEIIENSKLFKLSDDGKSYINTKTGKVYARVTSMISADERGSERFDEDNAWVLPSTNIGTTVDEFVRDFFAGTLRTVEVNTAGIESETTEQKDISTISDKTEAFNVEVSNGSQDFWNKIRAVNTGWQAQHPNGIVAYRRYGDKPQTFSAATVANGWIGNPFSTDKRGATTVQQFYDWLTTGNNFGNSRATEEFRQAIIQKILATPKNAPILYYTELGRPSHATVIGYLIANKQLLQSKTVAQQAAQQPVLPKGFTESTSRPGSIHIEFGGRYGYPEYLNARRPDLIAGDAYIHYDSNTDSFIIERGDRHGNYTTFNVKHLNDLISHDTETFKDSVAKQLEEYFRSKQTRKQYDYPNATSEQWEAFRKQLEDMKLKMEAQGFHVVPRDVVAAGTLNVVDNEGKTYNVETAGTLDLLAYDNQGNFYIFDMKTVHNPNSIESKKFKWSQQTSLYQKFLQNAFGIHVKGRYIIPIQVTYPSPDDVTYTQGEGTSILLNGKPYEGAKPYLMHTVSVDFYEPNIKYDKLTDKEKELAESIAEEATGVENMTGSPVEAKVANPEVPYIDPITGLAMDSNNLFGGLWNDPMLEGVPEVPSRNIMPTEMAWDNLSEEQRGILEKMGVSKESYDKIDTEEEINHIKDCLGL